MCHCSVVAQIRTLGPFFATPLLQLRLSLAVVCVNISVRFFCIGTPRFWERRGTAAAGSSPGSLTTGTGDGSVLDGQCGVAPRAGSTNTRCAEPCREFHPGICYY